MRNPSRRRWLLTIPGVILTFGRQIYKAINAASNTDWVLTRSGWLIEKAAELGAWLTTSVGNTVLIVIGLAWIAIALRWPEKEASTAVPVNRTPASPVAAVSGETGAPILTPGDNRIFINKSPRELLAPFRSGLTNYQVGKLLSDYVDKWVCWIVKIRNVTQFGECASVSTYIPDGLRLGIIVNMYFPVSETARVLHLEKDTVIKVEGQIKEMFSDEVRLENCRLVEVRPSS